MPTILFLSIAAVTAALPFAAGAGAEENATTPEAEADWRLQYGAPYVSAATEAEARRWKRSDEVFSDRLDWATQRKSTEAERVYPVLLRGAAPERPRSLKKETGNVEVSYLVERDGRVRDVRVLVSTNPLLESSCIATLRSWRFKPGTMAGKPAIWRYAHTCTYP